MTRLVLALCVVLSACNPADPKNQNDAQTTAGVAFSGYAGMLGQAGLYSHSQLLNPDGSGKVVYVDYVTYSTIGSATDLANGAASTLTIGFYNSPLSQQQIQPRNLYVGEAAATAQLRTEGKTTPSITAPYVYLSQPASAPSVKFTFDPPVRLDAGKGLSVELLTHSVGLMVNYQFRQYAVP